MSYETLDMIADSYTPILFIGFCLYAGLYWRAGDRLAGLKGLAGILIGYWVMWMDNTFHAWATLGLDYSTHTAVAGALIIFHLHKRPAKSAGALAFFCSFISYLALMRYQQYHTLMDMMTTLIVIVPLIWLAYFSIGLANKTHLKQNRQSIV